MKHEITQQDIDFCDNLVKNCDELKLKWNGGNDSGFLELFLNGVELLNTDKNVAAIISIANSVLGLVSFTGDFFVSGELIYNPVKKCFEGTHLYSGSAKDIHSCDIKIRLPQSLWFDSLGLHFHTNEYQELEDVQVNCLMKNGPRTPEFTIYENKAIDQLQEDLIKELETIKMLDSLWEDYVFDRSQAIVEGNDLVFTLNKFRYSFNEEYQNSLTIPLTKEK